MDKDKVDLAGPSSGKPYPPRWVMIYLLILAAALLVWIILDALHGGPPWSRHW